jgi:hypothetical protein
VAFHPPGTPFDQDRWELFHLDRDFSETEDLAASNPEQLRALIEVWWAEAERCQVLPLDDRFAPRFAENAARAQGARKRFVFHRGMGHLPTDVAPDVRSRAYRLEAQVVLTDGDAGVLLAHGDATSGYSLYVEEGRLAHVLNIGGQRTTLTSDQAIPPGRRRLGLDVSAGPGERTMTLLIDGAPAGSLTTAAKFATLISWSGLDIGRDRGSPVGLYAAPFEFSGRLDKVTVLMDAQDALDGEAIGKAEMARQ